MQIEITEITQEAKRDLGLSIRNMILNIMAQPGGREAIEKKKAEIRERRQRDGLNH